MQDRHPPVHHTPSFMDFLHSSLQSTAKNVRSNERVLAAGAGEVSPIASCQMRVVDETYTCNRGILYSKRHTLVIIDVRTERGSYFGWKERSQIRTVIDRREEGGQGTQKESSSRIGSYREKKRESICTNM